MSELHNRLAHLVNYSSQLIFVSGDTVADQQRTLSDFLASQEENTEISFITAEANKGAPEYRSAICRQLGGHTVGSFVRPLKQLLSDLKPNAGPYLVCITSADHLSPTFLQELWDWVMQSQQSQQKIHLNIILFGKADWAESSQEWLPIQNSHKPVLLSSQSVNSAGFDVNALEALMANERTWFNFASGPVVSNKWFIGGVLGLFLIIFVSMLSWQYPTQIKQIFTNTELAQQDLPAFDMPINTSDLAKVTLNKEAIVDLNLPFSDAELSSYRPNLEIVNKPILDASNELFEGTPAALTNAAIENISEDDVSKNKSSVTESLLVSSWQESIASSEYNKVPEPQASTSIEPPLPELKSYIETDNIANTEPENVNNTIVDADGDFQVPDIISIEQLDAQLGSNLNQLVSIDKNNEKNIEQKSILLQSAIDYRFDETTLLSLPTDAILLQLSGIQNPVVLESYLAKNNLKSSTWIYETQRYGGSWYVVLYRQSFESIDAALNLLSSLPEDVKNAEPFAKSVNQIQQEIKSR